MSIPKHNLEAAAMHMSIPKHNLEAAAMHMSIPKHNIEAAAMHKHITHFATRNQPFILHTNLQIQSSAKLTVQTTA